MLPALFFPLRFPCLHPKQRCHFLAGSDCFLLLLVTGSWDPDVPQATPLPRQVQGFDPDGTVPTGSLVPITPRGLYRG